MIHVHLAVASLDLHVPIAYSDLNDRVNINASSLRLLFQRFQLSTKLRKTLGALIQYVGQGADQRRTVRDLDYTFQSILAILIARAREPVPYRAQGFTRDLHPSLQRTVLGAGN